MEKFHSELSNLKKEVIEMGIFAMNMLRDSIECLKSLDLEFAESIHSRKTQLAKYDVDIEDKALKLVALYQPMAGDLRTIACIFKMNTHLTRIGRYGKDITNIVKNELKDKVHIKKLVSIPHMTEIVIKMVQDVLEAFDTGKLDKLRDLSDRDNEVDDLRMTIFRECLTYMFEDQKNIPICMAYIMVARYLERCGDHACNMAEKIHFMVTGKYIEIK
jgi:phosphate transport system protein